MGIIMKDLPQLLDLEGRRPSARRPVIVATLVLIVVSSLSVAGVLAWQYAANKESLARAFKDSPQLQSQLTSLPKGIDIAAFALRVESSLRIVADSISLLYTTQPTSPQHLSDTALQLPLVPTNTVIEAVRGTLGGLVPQTVTDGQDSAREIPAVQFHLARPFDRLMDVKRDGYSFDISNASWIKATANLLTRWHYSFPEDPLQRKKRDSTMHKQNVPSFVLPPNMIAHFYCALRLPLQTVPRPLLDTLMDIRKHILARDLWNGGTLLDTVAFEAMPRTKQDSISRALNDSDASPYVLLGTPAAPLPLDYDASRRPWFVTALQDGWVTWSPSYVDAGTGMPVVTASAPITRLLDGRMETIGVVAVDFFTRRLEEYPKPGYAYLMNFLLVLTVTLFLLAIIVSSSRRRFDLVLWALTTLLLLYAVKVVLWSADVNRSLPETWSEVPDVFLSMLSTISLVMAAIFVFKNFRHEYGSGDVIAPDRKAGPLATLLNPFHVMPDSYAASVVGAVISAVVLACINSVFDPTGNLGLVTWMNALLSAIGVILFGYYFSMWGRFYYRGWFVTLSLVAFLIYGAIQLPHPLLRSYSNYWYVLALAKSVPLFVIVLGIYFWVRNRNFDRVRRAGSRATILGRIGVPNSFLTIAGILDPDDRFLFVDRSTLSLLGWIKEKRAPSEPYQVNRHIAGWVRSELGDDLYVPENHTFRVPDLFDKEDYSKLKKAVLEKSPQVHMVKMLNDHRTKRCTQIRMIRGKSVALRGIDGEPHPITVVSMTAWMDIDQDTKGLPNAPTENSPWYFVLFATTNNLREHKALVKSTATVDESD